MASAISFFVAVKLYKRRSIAVTMNNRTDIDWARVRHLLKLGLIAACMVLIADMVIGWGTYNHEATELPAMWARFLLVSDERLIISALLGLIGIPVECLCWFSVYRMIKPYSEKYAHIYRAGILGCLAFGGCGVHVPCCMAAYLLKRFYANDTGTVYAEMLEFLKWFLLPATVIFLVFFFMAAIVQTAAFVKGYTPLPKWCFVFNILFGVIWIAVMRLLGDYAIVNALAAAWISVGNLWMMGGLLTATRRFIKR